MRTILCAVCAAAIFASTAWAQDKPGINLLGSGSIKPKTQDEVDAEAARNRDYQNTMKKLPDQAATKRDPWGNMRSNTADSDKKKRAGTQ